MRNQKPSTNNHAERLMRLIDDGVEIRHNMRVKSATKDAVIKAQRETILNQSAIINDMDKQVKELKSLNKGLNTRLTTAIDAREKSSAALKEKKNLIRTQAINLRKMKEWIEEHNGGQMPEGWIWGVDR